MPQINVQEAEKSLVEMGRELKALERDLEQAEEMAGRYGEAITLGQVRASAEGKIERLHQDMDATRDALTRALEELSPPSVCDYSSDGVLCNHGLNDLGVCVDSYCPVRVSATEAGREALAAWEVPAAVSLDEVRTCRVCGCTDEDCQQCVEAQGHPCHWVEDDLCSRCQSEARGQA